MPPTPKTPPKDSDWRLGHKTPERSYIGQCEIIRCPVCGHQGCVDWWIDQDNPGCKVQRVAHAHFLKPTYEQRRNYNHRLDFTSVRYKPYEVETVIRLRK